MLGAEALVAQMQGKIRLRDGQTGICFLLTAPELETADADSSNVISNDALTRDTRKQRILRLVTGWTSSCLILRGRLLIVVRVRSRDTQRLSACSKTGVHVS